MSEEIYKKEKRNFYNLKKYLAIGLDVGSASAVIVGIITNKPIIFSIGGSVALPLVFYSYDVWTEKEERKAKDITRLLESQRMFE